MNLFRRSLWVGTLACGLAGVPIGCGSNTADVPASTPNDTEVDEVASEVDDIIKAVDDAMTSAEGQTGSVGVMLQESLDSIAESHPDKADVISELRGIAQELEAEGAGKATLEKAKAKLQELK